MRKLFILLILILPFIPAIAFAAEWEYITYGGYDACLSAWKKVALIFSDNAYKGLFITAIALGAGFAFISAYIRIATGVKSGIYSWFVYMLMGAMIYAAFIAPKDKLTIYDQTLNRGPETVDDIPRGIATLAGILNKIEVGFVDIVSTSADPASDYRTNAGGTGFLLLDINPASASLRASLQRYVKDCVLAETVRPGTQLNPDAISDGRMSWDTIITESQNPSLYTVYYTEGNPAGDTKTCEEAGLLLMQALNDPLIQQTTTDAVCYSNSFSGPVGVQACKSLLDSTVQMIFQTGDTGLYIRQSIFANAMIDVITSSSTTEAMKAMATAKTQSNLIGMAAHANSWIPVIKETMKAVAISLVPFMALIAVTPLAGRALSLIAGMFLWVTLWGIVDAILHGMAIDLARQASDSLKVNGNLGMGLVQLMMLPQDYLPKVAATFGAIRWSGLMLSTVMTGMLVRFGGAALGMLAGSVTNIPQSSGAAYGSMVTNPGGIMSGEILPAKTQANAASMLAAQGGFRSLLEGSSRMQGGQLAGGASKGLAYGAGGFQKMTEVGLTRQMGDAQRFMNTYSMAQRNLGYSGNLDQFAIDAASNPVLSPAHGKISSPYGQAAFSSSGKVTSASVNSLNSASLSSIGKDTLMRNWTHELGKDEAIIKSFDNGTFFETMKGINKSDAQSFRESYAKNLEQSISNSSSLSDMTKFFVQSAMKAHAGGGIDLKVVKAGAEYSVVASSERGVIGERKVTEQEAQKFNQLLEESRTKTLEGFVKTQSGSKTLASTVDRLGIGENYRKVTRAINSDEIAQSVGADLVAPMVNYLIDTKYLSKAGEKRIVAADMALKELNVLALRGDLDTIKEYAKEAVGSSVYYQKPSGFEEVKEMVERNAPDSVTSQFGSVPEASNKVPEQPMGIAPDKDFQDRKNNIQKYSDKLVSDPGVMAAPGSGYIFMGGVKSVFYNQPPGNQQAMERNWQLLFRTGNLEEVNDWMRIKMQQNFKAKQ